MPSMMQAWSQTHPAVQKVVDNARVYTYDALDTAAVLWQRHKPESVVEYTAVLGAAFMAVALVAALLNFAAGVLLIVGWIGLCLYSTLVVVATGVFAVAGTSTFIFASTCAGVGGVVLSMAGMAHLATIAWQQCRDTSSNVLATCHQELEAAQHEARARKLQEVKPRLLPAVAASATDGTAVDQDALTMVASGH